MYALFAAKRCAAKCTEGNVQICRIQYNTDNKGYYDAWYQTPGKPKTLTGRTQFTWRKPSGNYPYRLYTDESKNEGFEFIYDPNSQTIEPIQPSLAQSSLRLVGKGRGDRKIRAV